MKRIILLINLIFIITLSGCEFLITTTTSTTITPEGVNHLGDAIYLAPEGTNQANLSVTFLQNLTPTLVEQDGDVIFIECGDVDILIDAGEKGVGAGTVSPYIEEHVEDNILELVILTHNDSDHIGGMIGYATEGDGALEVEGITYLNILDSGIKSTTATYASYMNIRDNLVSNGTNYYRLQDCFDEDKDAPSRFNLGADTYLDILDTGSYEYYTNTVNDQSVCALLVHKNNTFLLTGDAEEWLEDLIIPKLTEKMNTLGINHIDVFKANHHGSDTSNTVDFLNLVDPTYVVVCSSYKSSHDNPSKIVIDRIDSYTHEIYGIFIDGDITYTSDGTNILVTSSATTLTPIKGSTWWLEDNPDNPRP